MCKSIAKGICLNNWLQKFNLCRMKLIVTNEKAKSRGGFLILSWIEPWPWQPCEAQLGHNRWWLPVKGLILSVS